MNKIKYTILMASLALACVSCNNFLNEMPDSRAEINSKEKVGKLLVSAYPANAYIYVAELSSDNLDDYGDTNPYGDRFSEELFYWKDGKETDNESPASVWEACYGAIAAANQALAAIDEAGEPDDLKPFKGEALMCRAYAHFILTNLFCQHYSSQHADTDLGIPYMDKSETELNPKYERPSVAFVYEKMAADIEEGLPLINDTYYEIPKYHFNKNAAYTFASRFYLYYGNREKTIQYATVALGAAPQTLLRDNIQTATLPRTWANLCLRYVDAANKCNFLLHTGYSNLGVVFGNFYTGSRYSHGALISNTETLRAKGPWGNYSTNTFYVYPFTYSGTNLDKILLPHLPYVFEYTDPVAGIGYRRTVYAAFTAEEALLNRAEAYVLQKEYSKAMDDIRLWVNNTIKTGAGLVTETSIDEWANGFEYYTPTEPTPKKRLSPDFALESGKQENMIQFLLYVRRIETLHMGLRWFDVKRYGMEISRRIIQSAKVSSVVENALVKRDPRCAIQIPPDVISAGITPNPRNENKQ